MLLLREIDEQLHDREAVLDQEALPVVDLAVSAFEDALVARVRWELLVLEDLRMNPDDEHFLVVRAVEDDDLAARRQLLRVAPEKVVVELFRGGLPETVDDDALWVDAAHHVPDRAVLPARVECLERHEDAVAVLRREPGLVMVEEVYALLPVLAGSKSRANTTSEPGGTRNGSMNLRIRWTRASSIKVLQSHA